MNRLKPQKSYSNFNDELRWLWNSLYNLTQVCTVNKVAIMLQPSGKHVRAMNTPLKPHVYIVKLGYAGVYLFFLFLLKTQIVGTR